MPLSSLWDAAIAAMARMRLAPAEEQRRGWYQLDSAYGPDSLLWEWAGETWCYRVRHNGAYTEAWWESPEGVRWRQLEPLLWLQKQPIPTFARTNTYAECVICMDDIQDPVKCPRCSCVGCAACLDGWVALRGSCPQCRLAVQARTGVNMDPGPL